MIASILKGYKLVVVENKNDEHYNAALGEEGFLFLPAQNSTEVFLTIKGDKSKLGLRDRDYLKPEEMEKVKSLFPNLKILSFYTFENYIYHPDNLDELQLMGFDKDEYIAEIRKQKKEKLMAIIGEIGTSRSHYIEFKEGTKNDKDIAPIIEAIQSDEFEIFYPYFNMKNYFGRNYIAKFNCTVNELSKTEWFKKQFMQILKG